MPGLSFKNVPSILWKGFDTAFFEMGSIGSPVTQAIRDFVKPGNGGNDQPNGLSQFDNESNLGEKDFRKNKATNGPSGSIEFSRDEMPSGAVFGKITNVRDPSQTLSEAQDVKVVHNLTKGYSQGVDQAIKTVPKDHCNCDQIKRDTSNGIITETRTYKDVDGQNIKERTTISTKPLESTNGEF